MQIKIKRYRHSLFIQLLLECFALQQHLVKVTSPVTSSLFALLLVMRWVFLSVAVLYLATWATVLFWPAGSKATDWVLTSEPMSSHVAWHTRSFGHRGSTNLRGRAERHAAAVCQCRATFGWCACLFALGKTNNTKFKTWHQLVSSLVLVKKWHTINSFLIKNVGIVIHLWWFSFSTKRDFICELS